MKSSFIKAKETKANLKEDSARFPICLEVNVVVFSNHQVAVRVESNMSATAAREAFLLSAAQSMDDGNATTAAMLRSKALQLNKLTRKRSSHPSPVTDSCSTCGFNTVSHRIVDSRQGPKHDAVDQKLRISKCSTCQRRSKRIMTKESAPVPRTTKSTSSQMPSVSTEVPVRVTAKSNNNSKKRAKQRQDRDSLRTILSQKAESTTKTFSLLDFMAPGSK